MGHPDLKLPTASGSGFVPNQHRRRVSLPASPPETPAHFNGFFPKGAVNIPTHLVAQNFTFPISPPATPTRPQALPSDSLPTHTHQRLPSYDEKSRRASWHPDHRRLSNASLLRMAALSSRRMFTPTKIATFLLVFLCTFYLASFIAFPAGSPELAKARPSATRPRLRPNRPNGPLRVKKFGKDGPERHLSDERERQKWAEAMPEHMPHQIQVVPVVDVALDHDVIREHPESFQGERQAIRLAPGHNDIDEDEDAIAQESAEPAPKPVYYVGGRPVYRQREKGPERVQIGKEAEAPTVEVEEVVVDEEEAIYAPEAEAQETTLSEDIAEEEQVEVEEALLYAEEPVEDVEVEEVEAGKSTDEIAEEPVVVAPVFVKPKPNKIAAKKVVPAKVLNAVKADKTLPGTAKTPDVFAPPPPPAALPTVPVPPRIPHEAELVRDRILAGLNGRPAGRGEDGNMQRQRKAMLKQIKVAQGYGRQNIALQAGGALDSSTNNAQALPPPPFLEKDPRDSKRTVMKNPTRRKGAGKARVQKEEEIDEEVVPAGRKRVSPQAAEWREIHGDEDEGDDEFYAR